MKIVFLGTPEFAKIILQGLIDNNLSPVLVVTAPDKPVGRKQAITPPPVKTLSEKYNIPVLQPEKIKDYELKIKKYEPDLIVCAAYGQIIPKSILESPKYSSLNVHPSLLPKYRGASPIQTAILNGENKTGVTIMLMDEKMDHGPILAQQELESPISNIQFSKLHDELAKLGASLLVKTIPDWVNKKIKPQEQDHSQATFTKIFKKEDGKIDWTKPAKAIERQIRAFSNWPGSYCAFLTKKEIKKTFKVLEAATTEINSGKKPGEIFLTADKKLAVQTGQNCLILQKLQIEGKNPISADEFLLGHKDIVGIILI